MISELEELAGNIKDGKLRRMVLDFLKVPEINLEGEKLPLDKSPGGVYIHHAYEGGLIQHITAVTRLSHTLCDIVEEIYGGEINRDVVLAGALIHDVMKCYAYSSNGKGHFVTSSLGEKVDHLTLLVAEMVSRGFPIEVIHVAASHHGDQSPVKPKSLEALIVSIADLTDSEFSRKSMRAAEYLIRQTRGKSKRFTSSREIMKLLKTKAEEGWKGVRKLNKKKNE